MDKYFLTGLVVAVIVIAGCGNKYGNNIEELKEDVEYTQEEELRGFHYEKGWKINSIEIQDSLINTVHYSSTVVEDENIIKIGDTLYAFMHGFITFTRDDTVRLKFDFRAFDAQNFNRHDPSFVFPDGLTGKYDYDEKRDQITIDGLSMYNQACDTMPVEQCENRIPTDVSSVTLHVQELKKESLKIRWFDPWLNREYTMHLGIDPDSDQSY